MSNPTPTEAARKVVNGTLAVRRLTVAERNTLQERIAAAIVSAEERRAAREREACAKDADAHASGRCAYLARLIAESIRARSDNKGVKE